MLAKNISLLKLSMINVYSYFKKCIKIKYVQFCIDLQFKESNGFRFIGEIRKSTPNNVLRRTSNYTKSSLSCCRITQRGRGVILEGENHITPITPKLDIILSHLYKVSPPRVTYSLSLTLPQFLAFLICSNIIDSIL